MMRLAQMFRSVVLLAMVLVPIPSLDPAVARNLRSVEPIAPTGPMHTPARPVETPYGAVSRAVVQQAVERLLAAWGSTELRTMLADDFRGSTELVQNIVQEAPRDTSLRLLALRRTMTVEQAVHEGDTPSAPREVVDMVSAVALVQVEFSNPVTNAFERSQGEIELLLRIARPLVERPPGAAGGVSP